MSEIYAGAVPIYLPYDLSPFSPIPPLHLPHISPGELRPQFVTDLRFAEHAAAVQAPMAAAPPPPPPPPPVATDPNPSPQLSPTLALTLTLVLTLTLTRWRWRGPPTAAGTPPRGATQPT